jgi:hypothetical protein
VRDQLIVSKINQIEVGMIHKTKKIPSLAYSSQNVCTIPVMARMTSITDRAKSNRVWSKLMSSLGNQLSHWSCSSSVVRIDFNFLMEEVHL